MNRKTCALALLPLLLATPLGAASSKNAVPQTIAQSERAQASDYALVVLIPQTMIETSFDTGRVAAAPAGGLLDALIVSSMDNKKEVMANNLKEKAEKTIAPLRLALGGYDVDFEAVGWTENAITKVPWINHKSTSLFKTSLPAPTSPRVAQIRYSYDMSPDFSALRVFAEIDFAKETVGKKGEATGKHASFFAQSFTSIVQLRKRSYEASENVAAWTANDGKQIKDAFERAFAAVQQLLPLALELTPADIKAYTAKNREQGFAAGYNGPLIKRGGASADDVLMWNKGLLQVHTLP